MLRKLVTSLVSKKQFFTNPTLFSKYVFDNTQQVETILSKYPSPNGAVNPLLHLAQVENKGYIPEDAIRVIAEICEVPDVQVFECAYFYAMYNKEPVGKIQIDVCVTTPCMLTGAEEILSAIEDKLDIEIGETTEDGMFSLREMECMGCCVNAPMMAIADYSDPKNFSYDYYEDLDVKTAIKLIDELKSGKKPTPGPQNGRKNCEPKGGKTTLKTK